MKETRTAKIQAGESLRITGLAVKYDEPTQITDPAGSYTEIIRRGALDETDMSDVRLLVNHDERRIPLARSGRTMTLDRTEDGLQIQADLPDTEDGRAVYQAIVRGDMSGMSFAFTVPEDGSLYDPKTNTRTITRISKIYECSVVTFPAYQGTSVEARSQMLRAVEKRRLIIQANRILLWKDLSAF